MKRFQMEIRVRPRPGLLDPQGKAIHHALESLGYSGVADVRVGKIMDLELDAASEDEALDRAEEMCRKLLANPVTEDFQVIVAGTNAIPAEEAAGAGRPSGGTGTGGGDA